MAQMGDREQQGLDAYTAHVQASIDRERERLAKFTTYQEQIKTTLEQLEALPRKLQHKVCVPFGRRAFFQGHLESTNEYRVHLGSGYYVHCTAFQAREILNRRLQRVTQQAEASRKLVSEQEGRLKAFQMALVPGQAEDGTPFLDIKESYEDSEQLLKTAKKTATKTTTRTAATAATGTAPATTAASAVSAGQGATAAKAAKTACTGSSCVPSAAQSTVIAGMQPQKSGEAQISAPAAAGTMTAAGTWGRTTGPASNVGGLETMPTEDKVSQASQATQPTQQSLRDDKDLDAVFARMDQLALLEEQETADAGGDADDRGLDAEGTGLLPAVQEAALESDHTQGESETDSDDDSDDWAQAFAPVSLAPRATHTTTPPHTTTPTATHHATNTHQPNASHSPAHQPAAQPASKPVTSQAKGQQPASSAPKPALRKGFLLAPASPKPRSTGQGSVQHEGQGSGMGGSVSAGQATSNDGKAVTSTQQGPSARGAVDQTDKGSVQSSDANSGTDLDARRREAFTGTVLERQPGGGANTDSSSSTQGASSKISGVGSSAAAVPQAAGQDAGPAASAPARVSRFKMARQQARAE